MNRGSSFPNPSHLLLAGLLAGESPPRSRLQRWLPSSGTLPGLSEVLGGSRPARAADSLLRSLGQVIFLNNPLTGLLLFFALLLQSTALAIFALVGILTANATALVLGCDRGPLRDGIYGFNGALVGSAIGSFSDPTQQAALPLQLLLTLLGAALSTLLVHRLGGWMTSRLRLPVLTLPFCLVTWGVIVVVAASGIPLLDLSPNPPPLPDDPAAALLNALPRGFGQVFFCSGLWSGVLIGLAVVAASPIAALLGLMGAAIGALVGLLAGASPESVGLGLWSFDSLLTAIAIGGTFHAPTPRSLPPALGSAAIAAGLIPLFARLLPEGLPLLTFPFVVATLASLAVLRHWLPMMVPVALHAVVTPEEHLRRFLITRHLLTGFRRGLACVKTGGRRRSLTPGTDPLVLRRIGDIFHALDHDGSGGLVVAELVTGLMTQSSAGRAELTNRRRFRQLSVVIRSMDLDGDGTINLEEFTEMMLRLRLLMHGRERLRSYVLPIDEDGNGHLDPLELDRLLRSVNLPPLEESERRWLYADTPRGLSWEDFLDRLLLT